jgi:hypothetical protein
VATPDFRRLRKILNFEQMAIALQARPTATFAAGVARIDPFAVRALRA